MNRQNPWTEEEDKIIKEQYPENGSNIPINRPKTAIHQRACLLNIKKTGKNNNQLLNRVGETRKMSNGQIAEIIAYRNAMDIDIVFEDGTIVEHKQWAAFNKGIIKNPNFSKQTRKPKKYHVGMKKMMTCGQEAEIIKIHEHNKRSAAIDVRFDDGTIVKNKSISSFKYGHIANPNIPICNYTKRLGCSGGGPKQVICNGKTYNSIREFADFINLSCSCVSSLLNKGLTPEEVEKRADRNTVVDHNGVKYKSLKDATKAHGVPYSIVHKRIHSYGWTLEEALTLPFGTNRKRERLHNDRIGDVLKIANGLHVCVDGFFDNSCERFYGHFVEDPSVTLNSDYSTLKKGEIDHPNLHRRKKGTGFFGFNTNFIVEDGENIIYEAECTKCGLKEIFTPQQMIEHSKTHEQ